MRFLQAQPWAGALYTAANRPRNGEYVREHGGRADADGWVDGTFSLELIHHANPERGADIVVTYPWSSDRNPFGVPGTSGNAGGGITGPTTGPASGHGSFSPWDIRNTFMAWGADFKDGVRRDRAPAGNVDIAPTLLALEGLNARVADGRVLAEAFNGGPAERRLDVETRTFTTRSRG